MAGPGAVRQNHREERLFCHLLTDWILSQGTNASGHKPGAVQREESHKSHGVLQVCLPRLKQELEGSLKNFVRKVAGQKKKQNISSTGT